jgi:hypothetical protein
MSIVMFTGWIYMYLPVGGIRWPAIKTAVIQPPEAGLILHQKNIEAHPSSGTDGIGKTRSVGLLPPRVLIIRRKEGTEKVDGKPKKTGLWRRMSGAIFRCDQRV